MRRLFLLAALPLVMAQAPADPPRQVTLTIYNGDLALVRDSRTMAVPAGRTRLEFKDVSARIRPETVSLTGNGLGVVEQNFDYDLLTPEKMMEKAVGKQVQIVRTNPGTGKETTETATVLSTNAGVVLKIGNRIEVLRDDGIPTRVIFDGIPENLRARPTLSVTVESQNAGSRDVALSYLTGGLSWTADYVAQYDEKQNSMDLQGWVTLSNHSGTSYPDVMPRLVAGSVANTRPGVVSRPMPGPLPTRKAGVTSDSPEDFPTYVLPTRVTVADNQNKQISFLSQTGVKTRKSYDYHALGFDSMQTPAHADVTLNFSNTSRAMPAGTVRVYMRDEQGVSKFIGEERLGHTPAGSDLAVKLGEAFDVTVQSTLVKSENIARDRHRYEMKYEFRNARSAPVTVSFQQDGMSRDGSVQDETLPGKALDASTRSWDIAVPANGATTLTFTAIQE
jgi:hypothetical protein